MLVASIFSRSVGRRRVVKLPGFLWLLLPALTLAGGFWGCGILVEQGSTSTTGGSVSATSSGGGAGGGGAGGGAIVGGHIAAACQSDADCGGDLECLGPDAMDPVFGGGAAGGFCTRPCNADADCASDGGVCYKVDSNQAGRCTLACTFGPPISGIFSPLDPAKCRGREEVRCAQVATTVEVCLPTCGENAQCGGRACDPRAAVCVDTPNTGAPLGAPCDLKTPCAGVCISFLTGNASMCSQPCVLGGSVQQSDDCGGLEEGLCAFHASESGAGDTGFCTPACTSQQDCPIPGFGCFGVPPLTQQLGKGYCFAATPCPANEASDGGEASEAGDAGDTSDASCVCTPTDSGPLCLDPAFLPDGGAFDGGFGDAGVFDAGDVDAGPTDAGNDGG
jgi:hypothetical protein